MAVKYSSSGNSAMKASLVLMLLFGAVVAAHARQVDFYNHSCKTIEVDGKVIIADETKTIHLVDGKVDVKVEVKNKDGVTAPAKIEIPKNVTKVELETVGSGIGVKLLGVVGAGVGVVTGHYLDIDVDRNIGVNASFP